MERPTQESGALPTIWRKRDLALLIVLVTCIATDVRGMQFAGRAAFFYWVLSLVTFLLPSIGVVGWLTHQAPRRVPLYVWIMRLLHERWRSVVLFLAWWNGVLTILAAIGICLSLLQLVFPTWFDALLGPWLAFAALLTLVTVLTCLSPRLFRTLLWIGGGLLVTSVAFLLGVAVFAVLSGTRSVSHLSLHLPFISLPAPFSWSLFGLTVINLFGLGGPLLLDGEMRGAQRFLRGSTGYLWWGGFGAFLFMLIATETWLILNPSLQVLPTPLIQLFGPILGRGGVNFFWLLLFLGGVTCALAFLLIFSRVFLLAARLGYLPRALARLNPAGTPRRAILAQSALIACVAALLFGVAPALLRLFLSADLVDALFSGDQFGLLASLASALWCGLTALLFGFALWLFWKKRRRVQYTRLQHVLLPAMCLSGGLSSLVGTVAPLLPDWPALFFSHNRWFALVLLGILGSLVLAWESSELPRSSALVRAKARSLAREQALREELQRTYQRECELHHQLREAYDEQQVSLLKQRVLTREVGRLYQEQKQAALTDAVTGLPNHRAFIERLEAELARCRNDQTSLLLLFFDLDHFKTINDTWGHQTGDVVLQEVAKHIQHVLHPRDLAGRYGGEEFALIRVGATLDQARSEGEFLRRAIRCEYSPEQGAGKSSRRIRVTASIGVAASGIHGTQLEELIEQADQAMYQAKQAGRDCVRVADVPPSPGRSPAPMRHTTALELHGQGKRQRVPGASAVPVFTQTGHTLGALLQGYDARTSAHCARVSQLAEATGRDLGASEEDLLLMRLGGFCHDLGKVGIPHAVLQKAGPLTEEEWKVMQLHPEIGARILEHMGGFFQWVAPVVRAHHERWDGRGYPQGLKGVEIPLASRVLGVVDTYDTMMARRPYKEPIPASAVEAELRRNAGTQFDPAVVQAFLSVIKRQDFDWSHLGAGLHWDTLIQEYSRFFQERAQSERSTM